MGGTTTVQTNFISQSFLMLPPTIQKMNPMIFKAILKICATKQLFNLKLCSAENNRFNLSAYLEKQIIFRPFFVLNVENLSLKTY